MNYSQPAHKQMLYLLLQLLGGFLYRIDLVIAVILSQTSLLTLTAVIFPHWQSSEENKNSFIRFCLFSWGRVECAITRVDDWLWYMGYILENLTVFDASRDFQFSFTRRQPSLKWSELHRPILLNFYFAIRLFLLFTSFAAEST